MNVSVVVVEGDLDLVSGGQQEHGETREKMHLFTAGLTRETQPYQ